MKEVNFEEISGTSADSSIIIAAAGKGTRLNSNVPKILYPIAGKAILEWIYEYCSDLCGEIIIVLSPQGKKDVEPFINKKGFKNVKVAVQNTPIGMAQGYSIKTMRFRLNRWKLNDDISYELYDHKFDSAEINNVSNHKDYAEELDSLIEILNDKIIAAKRYPNGLGRQLKHARPYKEPKTFFSKY